MRGTRCTSFYGRTTSTVHVARAATAADTPVGKGSGLGLSISYSPIARHGGSISATSKTNEGATFRIKLPATEPQPGATCRFKQICGGSLRARAEISTGDPWAEDPAAT